MAFPTRLQVKQLFWQIADDPAAAVFTDIANATTGTPSVFQAGFSQAYDLLFNNALNQQIPLVEQVVSGIVVPPSPVPFSMTPADWGLPDFADVEWVSERTLGSSEKFIDLYDEDRLTQRAPTDRLLEFVYQNGAFQFVGCTTTRELQVKYVNSSGGAPTSDTTAVAFDGSLNFLANYSFGVMGANKGYEDTARRALSFAVGPKFDLGSIGGELFRLMQPLVRSRQNVQVAHRPYTTQSRLWARRGVPYVAAQAGTTGGGSQNTPVEYSSVGGGIIGTIDGVNSVFFINSGSVITFQLYRNGALMSLNIDYTAINTQFQMVSGQIPQPGDVLTANAWLQQQG